jgi:hypothetical protein
LVDEVSFADWFDEFNGDGYRVIAGTVEALIPLVENERGDVYLNHDLFGFVGDSWWFEYFAGDAVGATEPRHGHIQDRALRRDGVGVQQFPRRGNPRICGC